MPTFGLAALWKASARVEQVVELVERLGTLLPASKPPALTVALREETAGLELKLEVAGYPRQAVEAFAREVKKSGGDFVELWRLPKQERDAFRATSLGGPHSQALEDAASAARALRKHLLELAARPPVAAPPAPAPPAPAPAPAPPAPPAPAPPPAPAAAAAPPPPVPAPADSAEHRRGRRFAVKLELEFRTELEFVQEHALNISNGGLFVRTAHRPTVDSVVTVDVRLPNGERLQGEALVVHVVDDPYAGGVGLTFLSEDPTFAQTLDGYLASLAGGG